MIAVVAGVIVVAVFACAFFMGRRFGPLALSLAAGSLLAELWAEWLTIIIGGFGVALAGLPHGVVATLVLLLLPMTVLLFGGPQYTKKQQRLLSAAGIALMTAALLVKPLGRYLPQEVSTAEPYQLLLQWWALVVTIGLVAGVIDVFLLHTAKAPRGKSH
ncbi:MAG: hypothetical protein Q4A37_00800 [Candidatus Saccharibacteria bacterium]|nr:hypothetical protein [Candidatus Saccharibacteria bacterium]